MSGVPIHGFVGPNGGSKTLCMVQRMVLPAMERGKSIYSTCYIEDGFAIEFPEQLPFITGGVILFDEITSCFPSRESGTMPPEIQRLSNQLRKDDLQVGWTGPNWDRADKMWREVTDTVTVCRAYGDRRTLDERKAPDASAWPEHWLCRWKTFQVTTGDQFQVADTEQSKGKRRLRPTKTEWYRRPRDGSGAQAVYRTLDKVMVMSHLDALGTCGSCRLPQRKRYCQCKSPTKLSAPPIRTWAEVDRERTEIAEEMAHLEQMALERA